MALFKVFHAVDENDLPAERVSGNSYIIDDEAKDFLQWKVDVGTESGDRRGIASEGLIYSNGDMVTPEEITAVSFPCTLPVSDWVAGVADLTQTVTISGLKCGKDGDVPPIIQCTYNQEDYGRISSAVVNNDQITFTMSGLTPPTARIELTIVDF